MISLFGILSAMSISTRKSGEDHYNNIKFSFKPLEKKELGDLLHYLVGKTSLLDDDEVVWDKVIVRVMKHKLVAFNGTYQRASSEDGEIHNESLILDFEALIKSLEIKTITDESFEVVMIIEKDIDVQQDGEISYFLKRKEGGEIKKYLIEIDDMESLNE